MRLETFRAEMVELARKLIPTIANEDRASAEGDDIPGISVTVGADVDGWNYQTGDNSFTGGAYRYPHWAVTELYRDSQPEEFATEVISQLEDESREVEDCIFNEEHPAHE